MSRHFDFRVTVYLCLATGSLNFKLFWGGQYNCFCCDYGKQFLGHSTVIKLSHLRHNKKLIQKCYILIHIPIV